MKWGSVKVSLASTERWWRMCLLLKSRMTKFYNCNKVFFVSFSFSFVEKTSLWINKISNAQGGKSLSKLFIRRSCLFDYFPHNTKRSIPFILTDEKKGTIDLGDILKETVKFILVSMNWIQNIYFITEYFRWVLAVHFISIDT